MELSPESFNDMLAEMGQQIGWRRSDMCPCRSPVSGQANPACPTCSGRGVIWAAAIPAWTGVAGQRVQRAWADFGLFEAGDQVVTIPSDSPFYAAGENDRVTMQDSSEPFRAVFTHDGTDVVSYQIVEIDRVFWLDPTAQTPVDGGIPIVSQNGTFTWSTGAPPSGIQYTMRGRKRPEFYLFQNFPQDRAHFGGAALPRRVVLRRWDLFGR